MIPNFRAWDKDENKMWNVETLYIEDEWVKVNDGSIYGVTKDLIRSYCLMQSTSLKDINGTVIYEGDIVHVNYKLSIVKYAKGSFYIEFIDFPKIIMLSDFYFKSYTNDLILKVQGNIYETPELLEDN